MATREREDLRLKKKSFVEREFLKIGLGFAEGNWNLECNFGEPFGC